MLIYSCGVCFCPSLVSLIIIYLIELEKYVCLLVSCVNSGNTKKNNTKVGMVCFCSLRA